MPVKLLVYYVDKDVNSPENRHDPIAFVLLKLLLEQCRALVVILTTEIDDLCKNRVHKKSSMKKMKL